MLIYIPVIKVTGNSSGNVRSESFDARVTVFCSKAFEIIAFKTAVDGISTR